MHPVIQKLMEERPVVLDGAWGTQLQARGLKAGACPDLWNLDRPEHVEAVARAYVQAGSRVLLTNTFGANRFILGKHGLEGRVGEINRAGAALSRKAAQGKACVFASMGPTGEMLAMEDVTPEEMEAAFAEQAEALAEGGAEGLLVETMADVQEALLALRAARRTGLPVVVSMVFDSGADKDRTMMGALIEDAARAMQEGGAAAFGANCGAGFAGFATLCRRSIAASGLPFWGKPNVGLPQSVGGKTVYAATPEDFAAVAVELAAAGASMIGGCCGSSPDHIRAAAAALKAWRQGRL